LHEAIAEAVALCPPDFLVNVSLNRDKQITAFFAGNYIDAHRAGCTHVNANAMAPAPHEFPVVITSNSGHPLDQNLYQSVKGMSAAARIVERGGTIFMASACSDGIPDHGNFGGILRGHDSIEEIDAHLRGLSSTVLDQWQAQVLVRTLQRCEVRLFSQLDPGTVADCKLVPVAGLQRAVEEHIRSLGKGVPVAVMPEGPVTIPYVA